MSDSPSRKWKPLRDFGNTESDEAEDAVFEVDSEAEGEVVDEAIDNEVVESTPEVPLPPYVAHSPQWVGPPEEESTPETANNISLTNEPDSEQPSSEPVPDRVLLVQPVAATTRLIRETLENFTRAEVVATSDPLRGFELALQREYRLFLFGMQLGELSGPMLYELISKTYSSGWAPTRLAPGVIFIRDSEDPQLPDELSSDVRVKAVIHKPIRIDRLLQMIGTSIDLLDPTTGKMESSGS